MIDENLEDVVEYIYDPESEPPKVEEPAGGTTIQSNEITEDQRKAILLEAINSGDLVPKSAVDLLPRGQQDNTPAARQDDAELDDYQKQVLLEAQKLAEGIRNEYKTELESLKRQQWEMTKGVLAQNAAEQIIKSANVPPEAAPYVAEVVAKLPPEAFANGITVEAAKELGAYATGKAINAGAFDKRVSLTAPAPVTPGRSISLPKDMMPGVDAFESLTGRKMTPDDLKKLERMNGNA